MKIIQPGQINETPKDWWHGRRLTCLSCRCVFELEAGDEVKTTAERRPGGRKTVTAVCPTCDASVTHTEGGNFGTASWHSTVVLGEVAPLSGPGVPFFGPISSEPNTGAGNER